MVVGKLLYDCKITGAQRNPEGKLGSPLDEGPEKVESVEMFDDRGRFENARPEIWSLVDGRTPQAADMTELDVLAGTGNDLTEDMDQDF